MREMIHRGLLRSPFTYVQQKHLFTDSSIISNLINSYRFEGSRIKRGQIRRIIHVPLCIYISLNTMRFVPSSTRKAQEAGEEGSYITRYNKIWI